LLQKTHSGYHALRRAGTLHRPVGGADARRVS
jgi:hypothetical protein